MDIEDLPPVADAEESYSSAVQQEQTTGTQARDRIEDEKVAAAELGEVQKPFEDLVAGSEFKTLTVLLVARTPPMKPKESKIWKTIENTGQRRQRPLVNAARKAQGATYSLAAAPEGVQPAKDAFP